MKHFSLFLSVLLLLFSFTGCNKNNAEELTSSTNQSETEFSTVGNCTDNVDNTQSVLPSENSDTITLKTEQVDNPQDNTSNSSIKNPSTENTTNESQDNKVSTSEVLDKLKDSDIVTYYSDNPNNKYICAVADKYGVDKSCLVALIKTNAVYPGANVLQFTGERDENGKLVFSKKTFVAIYDISDTDGTIKRASRNNSENDGFTEDESEKTFMLFEMFVIRKLDDMRENKVYPE